MRIQLDAKQDVPATAVVTRAELAAALARIAHLEAQVAALQRPRLVDDPEADAALLAVIAARVEGRVFSAKELLAHAQLHADLRDALGAITTTRQIGTRLRRLSGRRCGAFRLQRVGRDDRGSVWSVLYVP